MSTLLIALMAPAHAQAPADWQFMAAPVLEADPAISWASQSVSNPSVVYDSINGQYLMFFESRTTTVDGRCPGGVWDVGVAQSADGVNWSINPTAVVAPSPNVPAYFYNCVAAHPTAVYSTLNWGSSRGHVYVYFKAEQVTPACSGTGTKTWGCGRYTGVGLAVVCFDAGGDPYRCSLVNRPVLTNSGNVNMGTPHAVSGPSGWRMTLGVFPDIYEATGSQYNSFTRGASPVLSRSVLRSTVPWVVDELVNPSLNCQDDPVGNMDLAMFVGGRDNDAVLGTLTGSWGKAVSDKTVVSYALDATPQQSWTGNDAWRHWEVRKLLNNDGEYVVYFDEKDASGNNHIRMGVTDPSLSWNDADFGGWRCD